MKSDSQDAGHYIKSLIKLGENEHLDFKFEISDAKKIARTFSAFANTGGGKLLIGVKDNGKISGVRSEEEVYMAESAAHLFCKPAVTYRVKKWFVDGRNVLEIEIPMSKGRPHYARNEAGDWTAYFRLFDQNIRANRILINVWKNEKKKKGVLLNYGKEEKILIDFLSENKQITLSKFMKIARTGRLQAENLLINLILMNIISMDITEKAVYYRLNNSVN
jgi:predicted HTH transcriptional regulator